MKIELRCALCDAPFELVEGPPWCAACKRGEVGVHVRCTNPECSSAAVAVEIKTFHLDADRAFSRINAQADNARHGKPNP